MWVYLFDGKPLSCVWLKHTVEGSWSLGAKSWNILIGSVGNMKPSKGLDVIKLSWGKLHAESELKIANWSELVSKNIWPQTLSPYMFKANLIWMWIHLVFHWQSCFISLRLLFRWGFSVIPNQVGITPVNNPGATAPQTNYNTQEISAQSLCHSNFN